MPPADFPHIELKQIDPGPHATLAAKLAKVSGICGKIPKDEVNGAQKYRYVTSDAVLAKVNPALVEAGLATYYKLEILDRRERQTASGGLLELCTVKVELHIVDTTTGAEIVTEGIGQGFDPGDKALSKAQTQGRKYALLLALNISTGDDPEKDAATDRATHPTAPCKKCGQPAQFCKEEDFDGEGGLQRIEIYWCEECREETRRLKGAPAKVKQIKPKKDDGGEKK